jgi:hypothetical protein
LQVKRARGWNYIQLCQVWIKKGSRDSCSTALRPQNGKNSKTSEDFNPKLMPRRRAESSLDRVAKTPEVPSQKEEEKTKLH